MFVSLKDAKSESPEDILAYVQKQIGKYTLYIGKAPKSISVTIDDFERFKFDLFDMRILPPDREIPLFYFKHCGLPIEIL